MKNYPTAENLSKIANVLQVKVYELFIEDYMKTNTKLLSEIELEIKKNLRIIKKLHIINYALRSLTN